MRPLFCFLFVLCFLFFCVNALCATKLMFTSRHGRCLHPQFIASNPFISSLLISQSNISKFDDILSSVTDFAIWQTPLCNCQRNIIWAGLRSYLLAKLAIKGSYDCLVYCAFRLVSNPTFHHPGHNPYTLSPNSAKKKEKSSFCGRPFFPLFYYFFLFCFFSFFSARRRGEQKH